jgi:hypothetical protein
VVTGVVFLTARNATSIAASLKRLSTLEPRPEHSLLVTDQRCPLRLGAKGNEHYQFLSQLGAERFDHVTLDLEQYAELDALVALMGQARVGDLEVRDTLGNARPVGVDELTESYHRLDRYRSHVLLHDLVTEDVLTILPPPPTAPLDPRLVRETIVGLLSWKTGAGAREVTAKVSEDRGIPVGDALFRQVVNVADELHQEGVIQCVPQENDRYLWWLGGNA